MGRGFLLASRRDPATVMPLVHAAFNTASGDQKGQIQSLPSTPAGCPGTALMSAACRVGCCCPVSTAASALMIDKQYSLQGSPPELAFSAFLHAQLNAEGVQCANRPRWVNRLLKVCSHPPPARRLLCSSLGTRAFCSTPVPIRAEIVQSLLNTQELSGQGFL